MITASTEINRFTIQVSTLMAAEISSGTNSRMRRVTGDDDNSHDYRPRVINPANEGIQIRLRQIDHHSYKSMECDHRSENQQSMTESYP